MLLFIVTLFGFVLVSCRPCKAGEFYKDCTSIDQTRAINGVCIILILLSHTYAKVTSFGFFDEAYIPVRTFLGQFVVVPFLFYSGYGIMESLSKKEFYLRDFPRKRLFRLFIRFFIITVIYVILNMLMGNFYSGAHILLSLFGITSIGNGGWYILSIFWFYVAVIICFNLFKKSRVVAAVSVALCLVVLILLEIKLNFPTYFYSTTIFLSVGMFYSLLKKPFDSFVMRNDIVLLTVLAVSAFLFLFGKGLVEKTVLFYPIWCGFGMLMLLCLTMKVRMQNKILVWFGKTVFFNFTLQGIPQMIFTRILSNNYVIYVLVLTVTITLIYIAEMLFSHIEASVLRRNKLHKLRVMSEER